MPGNLHQAAREGSLTEKQIRTYIINNGNIDAKDSNGLTLLCAAVVGGQTKIVQRLLTNGAMVNEPSIHNCTALWFATRLLDKEKAFKITDKLLKAGAQVNTISDPFMLSTTPLMNSLRAGHGLKVIGLLLMRKASVDFPGGAVSAERDAKFIGNKVYIDAFRKSLQSKPSLPSTMDTPVQSKSFFASAMDIVVGFLALVVSRFTKTVLPNRQAKVGSDPEEKPHSEELESSTPTFDPTIFSRNLAQHITQIGLNRYFPADSPILQAVITKASELAKSGDSVLASQEYLPGLSQLTLYQSIFFCDNSGSMNVKDRIDCMTDIVGKMTKICTLLLPSNEGVEIRFLNSGPKEEDLYKRYSTIRTPNEAANMIIEAQYTGTTKLGTILKREVLQPYVYNVLDNGSGELKRPLLISIITDGCPYGEDSNELAKVIKECKMTLRQRGINNNVVKFQISQIGDDTGAHEFLCQLRTDPNIKDDIYVTRGKIDEEFKNREENDEQLDIWLFKTLMGPILAEEI